MAIQAKPAMGKGGTLLLLLIALGLWGLDAWKKANGRSGNGERPVATSSNGGKAGQDSAGSKKLRQGEYEVYEGCVLDAERHNDGDSFQVKLPDGRVEVFRLYFVDTPESEFRTYAGGETNHERIQKQAGYFGLTLENAVEVGKRAKKFTLEQLSAKPFVIYTIWDSPYQDQRYHAFVEVQTSVGKRSLDEMLVEQGLCRIFTKGADTPAGVPMAKRKAELQAKEREARGRKLGAWGLR